MKFTPITIVKEPASLERIMRAVCQVEDVSVELFTSSIRTGEVADARKFFCFISREHHHNLESIAKKYHRNHCTVLNASKRFMEHWEKDGVQWRSRYHKIQQSVYRDQVEIEYDELIDQVKAIAVKKIILESRMRLLGLMPVKQPLNMPLSDFSSIAQA